MAAMLEKYLKLIRDATSKPGIYAYRGQSRAEWPLHSAATRRLAKSLGDDTVNAPGFSKVYIDYHRETLVDPARTRGFGVESGRDISDLQLLAKLQHFEAATGLLDFSWSPLIALWFASRKSDSDGKLFVLNVNDPIQVTRVSSELEQQAIDAVFSRPGNAPGLLYWEPMWTGDAMPRILRQRGVFIIGRPLIPTDSQIIREIEILETDKSSLLEELTLLDISASSLFPDVYGFSSSEKVTASIHVRTPYFYFVEGNQHYQTGNYREAIAAYDNCIFHSAGVGELYLLRGNAKSEAKLYREAVDDYRQVIVHRDRPLLASGPVGNSLILDLMLFMAYFNCGNALAELSECEAALASYSDAIRIDRQEIGSRHQVFFNRGNIHLDLGQPDKAIIDYDAAILLQENRMAPSRITFNKANALVVAGRFREALECYKLSELKGSGSKRSPQNRQTLERILSVIRSREYQSHFAIDSDSAFGRLVVEVAGTDVEHIIGLFQGRVGNTGNFGWNGVGGEGFDGSDGFIVELVAKPQIDVSTKRRPEG
jgi:tetratricopeptide (TPR) repeat protein